MFCTELCTDELFTMSDILFVFFIIVSKVIVITLRRRQAEIKGARCALTMSPITTLVL